MRSEPLDLIKELADLNIRQLRARVKKIANKRELLSPGKDATRGDLILWILREEHTLTELMGEDLEDDDFPHFGEDDTDE